MANDVDMYEDILNTLDEKEAELLNECYNAKFINNDNEYAEVLKNLYIKEYGCWGNYY